jgi:hypothetical protein
MLKSKLFEPTFKVHDVQAGETLTGVQGRIATSLVQLGFTTSAGRTLGPYGGAVGTPFSFNGNVYSFFGGISNNALTLTGIGFWTDGNKQAADVVSLSCSSRISNLVIFFVLPSFPHKPFRAFPRRV